jgi:hypothetical protein
LLAAPTDIRSKDGPALRSFTPFRRRLRSLGGDPPKPLPEPTAPWAPATIIDHGSGRERALKAYAAIRAKRVYRVIGFTHRRIQLSLRLRQIFLGDQHGRRTTRSFTDTRTDACRATAADGRQAGGEEEKESRQEGRRKESGAEKGQKSQEGRQKSRGEEIRQKGRQESCQEEKQEEKEGEALIAAPIREADTGFCARRPPEQSPEAFFLGRP